MHMIFPQNIVNLRRSILAVNYVFEREQNEKILAGDISVNICSDRRGNKIEIFHDLKWKN